MVNHSGIYWKSICNCGGLGKRTWWTGEAAPVLTKVKEVWGVGVGDYNFLYGFSSLDI